MLVTTRFKQDLLGHHCLFLGEMYMRMFLAQHFPKFPKFVTDVPRRHINFFSKMIPGYIISYEHQEAEQLPPIYTVINTYSSIVSEMYMLKCLAQNFPKGHIKFVADVPRRCMNFFSKMITGYIISYEHQEAEQSPLTTQL